MAREINEQDFNEVVLKSEQPVLVDFWAPWCGPCKSMAPVIEQLAEEFEGKAKVCKVNVDDNQSLAGKYKIMSIPTFLFFKNGEVVGQLVGYTAKNILAKKLDELVEG